jgi:hypothetical protein
MTHSFDLRCLLLHDVHLLQELKVFSFLSAELRVFRSISHLRKALNSLKVKLV